jgi:hypothetical protein
LCIKKGIKIIEFELFLELLREMFFIKEIKSILHQKMKEVEKMKMGEVKWS